MEREVKDEKEKEIEEEKEKKEKEEEKKVKIPPIFFLEHFIWKKWEK